MIENNGNYFDVLNYLSNTSIKIIENLNKDTWFFRKYSSKYWKHMKRLEKILNEYKY